MMDLIEEQELAPAGKVAYQFSARGHELSQILLALALVHPKDGATVYYRSRPFMLTSGLTPREAFAAGFARTGSPSEGRDVGVMFSLPARTGATILPTSGGVGAQYTPAAGWAQAIMYNQHQLKDLEWEGAIAVAHGGDGSVATNGFWSALTIATTQKLPMLFFIEDNQYGLSVPADIQTPGGNIARNLASFGNLAIFDGPGTQPEETAGLVHQAVAHVRKGTGPALLRLEVVRLTGHTFGEDQTAYKDDELIAQERRRDPYLLLKAFMDGKLDWESLEQEVEDNLRQAMRAAEQLAEPEPSEAPLHLFFDGQPPLVPPPDSNQPTPTRETALAQGPRINFSEALRTVIEDEMAANDRLLVFGEDVGPRGGVHRVTVDLQARFGPHRVFDTSLSEEGILGRSIGLAMAGLRPLAEIQFRKYADPATEHINDIGWLRWRTAGKFAAPVVVRIPVGHSRKTGDPWHSVSGEAVFAHTLGWQIAYPSNGEDAAGLLRTALRGPNPTLFLEHRALLDASQARRPYPGNDFVLPFGRAAALTAGERLTVVTWGEMVYRCLDAAAKLEGQVELIDLRTIIPWDRETVLDSVTRTGKCLVVHEDTYTAGFAGEILATVSDECFRFLDGPPRRLTTIDAPIPYNRRMMETAVIPSIEQITTAMQDLLAW
jgi:2-oxoisovalerate dehydrogenase E1 component